MKYLLISALTGSGSTSSISQRLVLCMRRPRSQHEARISRTREMTDKAGPQRLDCGSWRKVGEWAEKEEGLVLGGMVIWMIGISQPNDNTTVESLLDKLLPLRSKSLNGHNRGECR